MNRIFAIIVSSLLVDIAGAQQGSIIVHEWGTFTSLQDEAGKTIDGINNDDEPVPSFVHSMLPGNTLPLSQGYRAGDPTVTMRLETPVLYVYPADDRGGALPTMDVKVEFHGGLLTQFYPDAQVKVQALHANSRGRLVWSGLTLGNDRRGPTTDAHVWTAPRRPKSLSITTPKGESESYLFYRGVGSLDAPIKVSRHDDTIRISGRMTHSNANFARLWFCEFRSDGQVAWRAFNGLNPKRSTHLPAEFAPKDFSPENLHTLRTDMHAALVADGLYPDEATAMLDTWELSYFKSWGTRLFYIVPRAWTDSVLPIEITPSPLELKRVMVGRIDLVTPQHRLLLKQMRGADLTAQLPQLRQAYEDLGRFRTPSLRMTLPLVPRSRSSTSSIPTAGREIRK